MQSIRSAIRRNLPLGVRKAAYEGLRYLSQPVYRRKLSEIRRLEKLPRYHTARTGLIGEEVEFIDAASFLSAYHEIFEREIYNFLSEKPDPSIIDGGSNIGLSILYFKQMYPECKVIGFEPDVAAYAALEGNVSRRKLQNVELKRQALWSSDGPLSFFSEGADGGRIVQGDDAASNTVDAVRLRHYLNEPVDFLKLDIEGAEVDVLFDCADLLVNVKNLFVEFHSFEGKPQHLAALCQILETAGFRLHVHPSHTSPKPFCERTSILDMDLQLNIFAFRVQQPVP